jgi:hypothetical protein
MAIILAIQEAERLAQANSWRDPHLNRKKAGTMVQACHPGYVGNINRIPVQASQT